MQVTETVSDGLKREFKVIGPAADLVTKADVKLAQLKDQVRLNGFRPGKVPVAHIKRLYGRAVMAEMIETTVREANAEIITELALRLRLTGGPLGAVRRLLMRASRRLDPEAIIDLALRIGPYGLFRGGLSVASLRKRPHGVSLGPLVSRLPAMLRTASKRVELAPPAFVREVDALEATLASPVPALVLVGRRHLRSNNSWLHNSQRLVKGPARCTLLVNPEDARRHGVRDGERVSVRSARGTLEATATVSDEMMPGVVSLPHGWGHDRAGTRMGVAGAHAGVSINDITDEMRVDRLTGNAAFSAVPVALEAVKGDHTEPAPSRAP